MSRNTILSELNKIISDVTFSNTIISESSTADDVDGWDSLAHINIILAIEKFYNVTFSTSDMLGMANVKELIDIIEKKINA
jgi:acyl carrier protein